MGVWIENTDITPSWLTSPRAYGHQTYYVWEIFTFFSVLSPLTQGRGLTKECRSVPVIYKPFYVREKFTFFSPCVKYVFDFLRPPLPSFSGFFALFWCRSNVGRCRSKTNLSQKSKNFLRVPFSALPSFRGDSRWRSFPYLLYRENFYFFPRVRKVYIWVSPTVTSQFFRLFCTFFVTVGDGRLVRPHAGRGWKRCV